MSQKRSLPWQRSYLHSFIAYASFTMIDFLFKLYGAVRFFISRKGLTSMMMKRYTLMHNIVCVSCNMLWQTRYMAHLVSLGLAWSHLPLYTILIIGWIQEEYVVMNYLLNIWNPNDLLNLFLRSSLIKWTVFCTLEHWNQKHSNMNIELGFYQKLKFYFSED